VSPGRDEIVALIEGIWSTMLASDVASVETPAPAPPDGGSQRGSIEISGEWRGAVVLDLSVEQARLAASILLGMEAGDVSEVDAADVAGELINVLGGNLKAILPQPVRLGLPAVSRHGNADGLAPLPKEVARYAFSWQGGCFFVALVPAAA
jgi:chemotaxis protein CheX